MQGFAGMTAAHFLAACVLCILGGSSDDSPRMAAEEFSIWTKDLPARFSVSDHTCVVSVSLTQGHPLAPGLPPSRPASRHASINNTIPRRDSRFASRPPSFVAAQFINIEDGAMFTLASILR